MKEKVLQLIDQMFNDIDPGLLVKKHLGWNHAVEIDGKSQYTKSSCL